MLLEDITNIIKENRDNLTSEIGDYLEGLEMRKDQSYKTILGLLNSPYFNYNITKQDLKMIGCILLIQGSSNE